jgi:hypothetical protein
LRSEEVMRQRQREAERERNNGKRKRAYGGQVEHTLM